MRRLTLKKMAPALVAGVLAITLFPQSAQAAPRHDCPSGANPEVWNPTYTSTPAKANMRKDINGRTLELRYNSSARCAWGRISNGQRGDAVWIDWSSSGGVNREQYGLTHTESRSGTQVHTPAYNDAGYVMRACAQTINSSLFMCTDWY